MLDSACLIILEPDQENTYPFNQSNFKRIGQEHPSTKTVGFLSDKYSLPKSEFMDLIVRSDQIDRIRHFLNNTRNKFYSDDTESRKFQEAKEEMKIESDHQIYNNDKKIRFKINIREDYKISKTDLQKIKFFHVYMINILYSSEASFIKGLISGSWVFGKLFKNTLQSAKKFILKSKIFRHTDYYEDRNYMNKGLYMFTMPIKDGEIDYEVIDQCIDYVRSRLLNITFMSDLFQLKKTENACNSIINQDFGTADIKEKLIKFSLFDVLSKGLRYFYKNLKPRSHCQSRVEQPLSKQKDIESRIKQKNEENKGEQEYKPYDKRKHWNLAEYYNHQYGYNITDEEIYILNKLTTPKENLIVKTSSVSFLFLNYTNNEY